MEKNHLARLDLLRGIHGSRFRDEQVAVAQIEYRYPIYKRFSGGAFTGFGDGIGLPLSDFELAKKDVVD
ncbi:MAG: hypothetical protein ONB16_01115 [candidate division KSB1 bacterium]|nr:hypothetical protein [candidate division KSB1 bacterium]MDZ7319678.1 hypothetical protein [candidate division KSB1 bacterium]MDZ7341829.1 hypothetical protein [candidate division KSB1 bacterium]